MARRKNDPAEKQRRMEELRGLLRQNWKAEKKGLAQRLGVSRYTLYQYLHELVREGFEPAVWALNGGPIDQQPGESIHDRPGREAGASGLPSRSQDQERPTGRRYGHLLEFPGGRRDNQRTGRRSKATDGGGDVFPPEIGVSTRRDVQKMLSQHGLVVVDQLHELNRATWRALETVEDIHPSNLQVQTRAKVIAELRQQLALQVELLKQLYGVEAMREFMQEVLDVVGEVAPDARHEIIRRLRDRRALRRAVSEE